MAGDCITYATSRMAEMALAWATPEDRDFVAAMVRRHPMSDEDKALVAEAMGVEL